MVRVVCGTYRWWCLSGVRVMSLWYELLLNVEAVTGCELKLYGPLMRASLKEKSLEVVLGDSKVAACQCWAVPHAGGTTFATAVSSCSSWVSVVFSLSPRLLLAGHGHSECRRTHRCTPGSLRRNPAAGSWLRRRSWGGLREGGLVGKRKE